MVEFLKQLAEEIQNNKSLARRLAKPIQQVLQTDSQDLTTAKTPKTKPRKEYTHPQEFDAYRIFYDRGSIGLYESMRDFSVDELKSVLINFTNIPRPDYIRKKDHNTLLEMAVEGVKRMASRGFAFGDYRLPE